MEVAFLFCFMTGDVNVNIRECAHGYSNVTSKRILKNSSDNYSDNTKEILRRKIFIIVSYAIEM